MSGWSAHSILRYVTVIVVVIAAWVGGYGAFGHRVITALYHAPTSWLGDRLMSGRAHTPLALPAPGRRNDALILRAFALMLFLPLLAGMRDRSRRVSCWLWL
jgi:hypothetical protein